MRHLDQVSRAPSGTDDRTHGPLAKASQILGARSASVRGPDEGLLWEDTMTWKHGGQSAVESQAENPLANFAKPESLTDEGTGQNSRDAAGLKTGREGG